jgi:hypothetical protein
MALGGPPTRTRHSQLGPPAASPLPRESPFRSRGALDLERYALARSPWGQILHVHPADEGDHEPPPFGSAKLVPPLHSSREGPSDGAYHQQKRCARQEDHRKGDCSIRDFQMSKGTALHPPAEEGLRCSDRPVACDSAKENRPHGHNRVGDAMVRNSVLRRDSSYPP